MTRNLSRPWIIPPFGRCRRCGDPVKRPAARLSSPCWRVARRGKAKMVGWFHTFVDEGFCGSSRLRSEWSW